MPCEIHDVRCPLELKTYTWMFNIPTFVAIMYSNQSTFVYPKVVQLNESLSFPKQDFQKFPKYPKPTIVMVTPYFIFKDFFDHKYCIIICLVYVLVLALLCLTLILIFKNKFESKI